MDWEVAGQDSTGNGGKVPSPISPRRKGGKLKKRVIAVVVLVALIAFFNISSCIRNQPKNLTWPSTGLATMLPDPPTSKGEVSADSDTQFSAHIDKCSQEQYKAYVESCKEKGFTVDAEGDTSAFSAYNNDGYELRLSYFSSKEEISVNLSAPVEMGVLSWPTSGAGSYAPKPVSTKGKVSSDSSTFFSVVVGDTDSTAYGEYVDSCIAAGFNVDYHKGETSFYADNSNGVHISVSSEGFSTMKVTVDASKMTAEAEEAVPAAEPETQAEPDATADTTTTDSSAESGTSDFRQFVDDYEAFMNSYCDFMEKYQASSNPATMLVEYGKFVKEYAEWTQKYDDYESGDLSADDSAYLLAAQGRVLQRLSSIGQ